MPSTPKVKPTLIMEPDKTEDDKMIEFFVAQPMRLAKRCMEKLFTDDSFYFSARYAWTSPEDAKKLFLYGCARQVMKSSAALLQYKELVSGPPDKDLDTMHRTLIEAFIDEQNFWIRKLIELLINLINFSESDRGELYRVYLNAENFDLFSGKSVDFDDFYGFTSGNIEHSIDGYVKRILGDLAIIGSNYLWFLNLKKVKQREPSVFAGIKQKFKRALPLASADEAIVIGATYHGHYSLSSQSIHPTVGSTVRNYDFETLKMNITHISLLGQHIMNRINKLGGLEDEESLDKIMNGKSKAAHYLAATAKKEFETGDLVIVGNELAEVIDCKRSIFGYTGYKVKFLVKSLLLELPEDWVPSDSVIRLLRKSLIRPFMENSFNQAMAKDSSIVTLEIREGFFSQSDDLLLESAKRTFIELHKHGVLIPMLAEMNKRKEASDDSE